MALRQDQYLSMLKLSNLSPFWNPPFPSLPLPLPSPPPRRFFFSVDLFVRRRGLMDIMGIVSRNPSVHYI